MPEFQRWTNNARASPGGDACQQPPADRKKIVERNVKIGSWNMVSMTGRGRDLVEVCKRRNPMCAGNYVDRQDRMRVGRMI